MGTRQCPGWFFKTLLDNPRHAARFHRRRLKRCFDTDTAQTRVLKVLALLVESGSVYCVILVSQPFPILAERKRVAELALADFGPRIPAARASYSVGHRHLFSVRVSSAHRGNYLHFSEESASGSQCRRPSHRPSTPQSSSSSPRATLRHSNGVCRKTAPVCQDLTMGTCAFHRTL